MSEERRLLVLRAIVQDYVHTSEPVGSKALLDRHALGVSAATIRNDMASLEEDGLIANAAKVGNHLSARLKRNGHGTLAKHFLVARSDAG